MNRQWENCVGFQVVDTQLNARKFSVFRNFQGGTENPISFTIDVVDGSCDCGQWQAYGVPCVDAMAYFRLYRNMTLQHIIDTYVDKQHTYNHEHKVLKNNFFPVCMQRISYDGITLPPTRSNKRSTGRPRKIRFRKRSRWAYEPEKSNIVCSKCRQRGHNVRTCLARQALANEEGSQLEELDLL